MSGLLLPNREPVQPAAFRIRTYEIAANNCEIQARMIRAPSKQRWRVEAPSTGFFPIFTCASCMMIRGGMKFSTRSG